jgi:hypothetical protein
MKQQMHHSPEGAYVRSSDACPPAERARRLKSVARVMRREACNTRQRADFMERHADLLEKRACALSERVPESDADMWDEEEMPGEAEDASSVPDEAGPAVVADAPPQQPPRGRAAFLADQARRLAQRVLILTAAVGSAVSAAATATLQQRALP